MGGQGAPRPPPSAMEQYIESLNIEQPPRNVPQTFEELAVGGDSRAPTG